MPLQQHSVPVADGPDQAAVIDATLPVRVGPGLVMDPTEARALGARLADKYCTADPYPHIVLNNFLPRSLAEGILRSFPIAAAPTRKRQIMPAECTDYVRRIFGFFNSPAMLAFLEGLTRIERLISDPHFEGGGFHEIARGGKLGLRTDFRPHSNPRLSRRLNLQIYLNKNWEEVYRGHLELWDRSAKHKVQGIAPLFNRCVVFSTAKDSYHGYPDPLNVPANRTRKSMVLCYYTASERICEVTPAKPCVVQPKNKRHFSLGEVLPPMLYRALRTIKQGVKPPP
jgi:2OG-Fe(II) oxygenase superfamily